MQSGFRERACCETLKNSDGLLNEVLKSNSIIIYHHYLSYIGVKTLPEGGE